VTVPPDPQPPQPTPLTAPAVPDPSGKPRAAVPSTWQTATVEAIHDETSSARTFRLRLAEPRTHLAGQHYVVRLTAEDGYAASRSYSVSSAPIDPAIVELSVERFDDGEVSGFLHDVVEAGDELEVRGPIGGWFVWSADTPALLVGGGSGIAPLMSMLRLARHLGRTDLVRVLVSARAPEELWFADELPGPEVRIAYTRSAPAGDPRPVSRLTIDDMPAALPPDLTAFVCGSTPFTNHATELLVAAGVAPSSIRVERFGPTA
jgi:ferredoxin-NADP reductase